jgi:predicted DNA-binding transcriptional regulator YafY
MREGPWLADWRRVRWMPVYESVHPTAQRLILAAMRNEKILLRYWGGNTPGRLRSVSPGVVFQVCGRGPLYVAGYCHLRRAERVFRVDRVKIAGDANLIIWITE